MADYILKINSHYNIKSSIIFNKINRD
ncbi:protein of unknown function [Bradyrhizobium vignae]|uniref:Uncharacterized protein n=1 Tax=Bradyrhizobium vignae TaxID=1549949 RepID=A0A2U3PXM9_9BRAD|nr:protein of unknown function [Bradyrhizobium vignae]